MGYSVLPFMVLVFFMSWNSLTWGKPNVQRGEKLSDQMFEVDYSKHLIHLERINNSYASSTFQLREALFSYLKWASNSQKVEPLAAPRKREGTCDCYVGEYLRRSVSWMDYCARTKYLLNLAQAKTMSGLLDQRVEGLYIYMSLSYPMIHCTSLDRDKQFKRLHETISFIIGKLWLHNLLETEECRRLPAWAYVTLFKVCWEHARLGEKLGKNHYLYTARFYEKILNKKIVTRKPFTTKGYYNASWMYLQINRFEDSRRMAKLMPTYPGMHTAPKQLLKWNQKKMQQMNKNK